MKKFKYRIESYLKYSKFLRDKAFKDMKKAEMAKLNLEQKMEWMNGEMKNSFVKNSEIGKSIQDIHFINDNNRFMKMLKEQMINLSLEIQKADEIYQEKFRKLIEMQKKVKQLETHKENEWNKYKNEVKRIMQKRMDDINSSKTRG